MLRSVIIIGFVVLVRRCYSVRGFSDHEVYPGVKTRYHYLRQNVQTDKHHDEELPGSALNEAEVPVRLQHGCAVQLYVTQEQTQEPDQEQQEPLVFGGEDEELTIVDDEEISVESGDDEGDEDDA